MLRMIFPLIAEIILFVYIMGMPPLTITTTSVDENSSEIILGKYELATSVKAQDFLELMKTMDFKEPDRDRIRKHSFITVEFERDGERWLYRIKTEFRTVVSKFIPGVEFNDTVFDGRPHRALVQIINNTLIRDEIFENFTCHHIFVFGHQGFNLTYSVTKNGEVTTARQVYKRVDRQSFLDVLGL